MLDGYLRERVGGLTLEHFIEGLRLSEAGIRSAGPRWTSGRRDHLRGRDHLPADAEDVDRAGIGSDGVEGVRV